MSGIYSVISIKHCNEYSSQNSKTEKIEKNKDQKGKNKTIAFSRQ